MTKPVYQVIHIEQRVSKLNGGYYYLIKLQDIRTLQTFETSVDPAYKNYRNWTQIIEDQHRGQLITGVSTVHRKGKNIIDADSKPIQQIVCDKSELLHQLSDWRNRSPSQDLFE